ncbi:MAG: aminotransferase class V-fold PLP-dependent enzyme, partial [Oligoflexia bacterium]|nr:aminotransferase class V-fold PLP-dependent enzyme [Oligoflexia bacterium]
KQTHRVLFHSGATEGINLLVKGWALNLKKSKSSHNNFFYFSDVDHSAVWNLQDDLHLYAPETISTNDEKNGKIKTVRIAVNSCGEYEFNYELFASSNFGSSSGSNSASNVGSDLNLNINRLLNFTYVNNETGVVNSLEKVVNLKQKYPELLIHVDAVQLLGKVNNFKLLDPHIDFYTFSGHKFGALTGIGFSLIKKGTEKFIHPLITGGGQQSNLRSGSENFYGVYSLMKALQYLEKHFSYEEQLRAKKYFENELKKFLKDNNRGEIVGIDAKERDLTTIMFIVYDCKSDILQMAFDLAGIDVSRGSACKAQTAEVSRVLLAMGYSVDMAKKAIRISFSTYMTLKKAQQYFQKVKNILERFVK